MKEENENILVFNAKSAKRLTVSNQKTIDQVLSAIQSCADRGGNCSLVEKHLISDDVLKKVIEKGFSVTTHEDQFMPHMKSYVFSW